MLPMAFAKVSSEMVRGSSLSVVCGMKYIRPGRTSRTELTWAETCLMLSKIVPSSLQKMMLLCLPISSMMRRFLLRSPSSSRCSISNSMIRSSPGWDTLTMRPVPMCFLSSMQKFGAVSGLGLLVSVKYTRGRLALADTERRRVSLLFFTVNISSSFSGWAILLILPPSNFCRISWTRFAITIPSNAILQYSSFI